MCNACGFSCCAWDVFSGCGCEHCDNPECWVYCDECGEAGHTAEECWDEEDYIEEAA